MKTIICGVSGQDGAYLAFLLLGVRFYNVGSRECLDDAGTDEIAI